MLKEGLNAVTLIVHLRVPNKMMTLPCPFLSDFVRITPDNCLPGYISSVLRGRTGVRWTVKSIFCNSLRMLYFSWHLSHC
jgi:hypothetical protein